ncbi:MAG: DUF4079 family protein [Cyanobium sp.]
MPVADHLSLAEGLALLHPLVMILFVYPVAAVTVRLATHVRERRLDLHPQPATVLVEHAQHGQWLTSGVLLAVLLAQLWQAFSGPASPPEPPRAALLLALASLVAALALWGVRRTAVRLLVALLSWCGLVGLELVRPGLPPAGGAVDLAVARGSAAMALAHSPHAWGGLLVCGLLLASSALRPAIGPRLAVRQLHALAGALVALLLVFEAISGCRALLTWRLAG